MEDKIFFEQVLGIPNLRVDEVEYAANKYIFYCHSEQDPTVCPSCGSAENKAVKSYDRRKIRDLNITDKEVWLYIQVRQFQCDCGRYYNEHFDWVEPGKSYTKRQSKFIFDMCASQPFTAAASILNMCSKTVERVYYDTAQSRANLRKRYAQVRKLGIDEVSLRKGKGDYCCVLTDLERGIQVDILPNRNKATLMAHFEELGDDFCAQIEHVACDMWGPYRDVVEACFPNAVVTIDRFHVVKLLNKALDSIRKELRKKQPKVDVFKRLKWSLFKRTTKLRPTEVQALENAFAQAPVLEETYLLRNSFHAIFDKAPDKATAGKWLNQWIEDVRFTGSEVWDKFLITLGNWGDLILNFVETRITNAVTEGLNNLTRYIRRISFGIPNFEHMRLRVLVSSS